MKVQLFLFLTFLSTYSLQSTSCKINRTTPNLKQCASPWGTKLLLQSSSTICQAGSMITTFAAVFQSTGKTINGQVVTPEVLNEALKQQSAQLSQTQVDQFLAQNGFSPLGTISDTNEIKNQICANNVVMLINEATGHVVLATGFEQESYFVNDPTQQNRGIYSSTEVTRAIVYSL